MNPSLHTTADLPSGKNLTADTGVASVVRVLQRCKGGGLVLSLGIMKLVSCCGIMKLA
jgi:hypothetical protein